MEFDIGNILYIVITIVAVIVGLLGKKKKPAGQGTGESQENSRPGFLENLEKVFNMTQPEPVVVELQDHEEDIPEEEESVDNYPVRLIDQPQQSQDQGIYSFETDSLTESLDVLQLEDDQAVDYFEIIKDFDAGTAIVYSAIINRVEY